MIDQWKSFLLERRAEWNLPMAGEWSFLLHNNYHPQCSNLNVLWFHNGRGFPRVVTKLYRQPEILKREFENLNRVHSCAPAWVPKPLNFGSQGEFWALWMEGVPGLPLHTRTDYPPAVLRSMVDMLASIHGAVRNGGRRPDPGRYRRLVLDPMQTVAQFGQSASVRAGCAKLAAAISAEWVDSLPVIPQHGDLALGNVLSCRGQSHIVDWETFGRIDLPFFDLLTFLFSLLRGEGKTPEQWDPSLMRQAPVLIARYSRALSLPTADLWLVLPLALANWLHLQWSDGHQEAATRMYEMIEHHSEHPNLWQSAFLSS